ncbi:unnamed protein product [Parnassius apollo]|uniref:(apollo) hypothetical protein n=1 Tax=Parnassius apollo TaxID=110799 RepID=A0A8S3YIE7_PARAO|nr:unnamed protein product [Parnassius apollo]
MAFITNSKLKVPTTDLINTMKEKRCLWDRNSIHYKDRVKRDQAWKEVYKVFEPNYDMLQESEQTEIGSQVTKKWYNIRDAYAKCFKVGGGKRNYVYSELLSFLDPIYYKVNNSEMEENNLNIEDSNSAEDNEDSSSKHRDEIFLEIEEDDLETKTKTSKLRNSPESDTWYGSFSSLKKKRKRYMQSTPNSSKRNVPTLELIEAVKGKRCLWDRRSMSYRDRAQREIAWKEVYKMFEPNFHELQESEKMDVGSQITKKWYNIRDAYAKTCKNFAVKRQKYVYAEQLKFLDPIYCDQSNSETEPNITSILKNADDSHSDNDENLGHFQEEVFLEVGDDIFESGTNRSESENFLASEGNNSLTVEKNRTLQILGNLIEKEEDEDRSFFKAVLSSVKSLSEDSKLEFRISVLKLIQTLKTKDKQRNSIKTEMSRIYLEDE